ncbi:hypothetical protein O6P43_013779 [Quillaja saponaria]|uniref:Uncharacterized protein n=1 Tax=Quillaja saponaria TaxID=32244 RepID=A0AAD7LTJ1_QUISA|nr:hypothetical protein O6P43_013779 [Quillaja saponaria]
MSSEGGSPSAPPFEMSDDHPTDDTIVPVGKEPTYQSGKGKVLPPSLAYHPSTSSGSDNTKSRSFEVEDEAIALSCFLPERDEDEESNDNAKFDLYQGHTDNNKEWKPRYFFIEAPRSTAEVQRLGAEVEGWLKKCHKQSEEAARLREELERCRAFELQVALLKEETAQAAESLAKRDEEIARLRVELDASKKEARIAVKNFKVQTSVEE